MKIVLKNDAGKYIKEFNTAEGKVELTENAQEAKDYSRGDWFASMELESIQFYFPEMKDELKTMHVTHLDYDDDDDLEMTDVGGLEVPNVGDLDF